jgi:hypothetical protein
VDPRNTTFSWPSTRLGNGASRVQACFFENDGTSINGSLGTPRTVQNLTFRSLGSSGNSFIGSTNENSLRIFNSLTVTRTNSTKFSTNRYVLVRLVTNLGSGFTSDCTGTQSGNSTTFTSNLYPTSSDVYLVKLNPITLTQTRTFTVLPKNGRQN